MAFGTRVVFEEVKEKAFGDISATYTVLGTPTSNHVRVITFQNSTDQNIYISFDGVTDQLKVSSNSFKLFDLSSNKIRDDGLFIGVSTQIYVRYESVLGTVGSVWVEVLAAEGGK